MRMLLNMAIVALVVSSDGCSSSSSAQRGTTADEAMVGGLAAYLERLNATQAIFVGHDDEDYYAFDYEPWVSDGTAEGTFQVLDIFPGEDGSVLFPADGNIFQLIDEIAYFVATDGVNGVALWSTDGTAEGTAMEAMLVPLPLRFGLRSTTAVGNKIYVSGTSREPETNEVIEAHLFVITIE